MVEQKRQLVTAELAGQGHRNGPGLECPEIEGDPVTRVGGVKAHMVAGLNLKVNEGGGHPVGRLV
jgi:hypothetical protein